MEELIFFLVFIVWYGGSLIVSEKIGKKSSLGEEWTFFTAFIFSPIIAGILARLMMKRK